MSKIRYIWQVSPENYIHSHAFDEVVQAFHEALAALGHKAEIVYKEPPREGWTLVFGAHLCQKLLPPEFIIYNTEVIDADSTWMKSSYSRILRNHQIWDYSQKNVAALKARGLHALYCEIGYMPSMRRFVSTKQDIEVLFIGSPNSRRDLLMKTLSRHFKTEYRHSVYGLERDDLIARAKIVLNVHYYENAPFEIFRCAHLMANSKCIISEFGADPDIERRYYKSIDFCNYDEIPSQCEELLGNATLRETYETGGFLQFSSYPQIDFLKPVLERMVA